jgi:hypothetical protein
MEKYKTIHENKVMINPPKVLKSVLLIKEFDCQDREELILGVADNKASAMKMINEYYGKEAIISDIKNVIESRIDFYLKVKANRCYYELTAYWFELNKI